MNAEPLLGKTAQEDLQALGSPVGALLLRWLRGLARGEVPGWQVRLLPGAPRDPPWQWVRYVDGIVVIFRFLSEEELLNRGSQGPQILIARITSETELATAAQELLRDAP